MAKAKAKQDAPHEPEAPAVLAVDVGGSHVKILLNGDSDRRRFVSGKRMTAEQMATGVLELAEGLDYEYVSVGVPAPVHAGRVVREPVNLGKGWTGFDFQSAFGKPTKVINDAAMQALGSYQGGRMLFLGLGTGLGSALVSEHVVVPLELGGLPCGQDEILFDRLGRKGLEKYGADAWRAAVAQAVNALREAFSADYVVLGGGNAERVGALPPCTRRGGNEDAFKGGFMLWEEVVEPHDQQPGRVWRVVR